MRKLLIYFLMCCATMTAQRVNYNEGAITIEGDTMLWTLKTDGTQYPRMRALGLNTVFVPAYWELMELVEGKSDFTLIDQGI